MKKFILIALLFSNQAMAQIKNGEMLPNIQFTKLLNAAKPEINLNQLKGKIVWLEFWATWCGSCLSAMPHLKALQKTYGDKLQIINISDESEKRISAYLKSKPSNLWFAIDTSGSIAKMFPHQLLPHSILISQDGELLSSTRPELISTSIIDSLLARQTIHLPEKKDRLHHSYEELVDEIFPVDPLLKQRFLMQKEILGTGGFSTTYLSDNRYKGKRITAVNLGLSALYRMAFPDFPYKRVLDQSPSTEHSPSYCLDLMVSNEKDLLPELRKELLKRFDVQVRTEKQWKEIYILKINDRKKFQSIPINTNGERTYYSRHGEIDQQAISMVDFANYLDNFGTEKLMILDGTNSLGKFDIKFSFEPERPSSLKKILEDMGLVLEKEKRAIEMLIIYKS